MSTDDILAEYAKANGFALVTETVRTPEQDGIRLRMRLPMLWSNAFIDTELMHAAHLPVRIDTLFKTIDRLKVQLFEKVYKHLAKYDPRGEIESYQRIAKQACELALKHMRPSDPEYGEIEHCLEYVTRKR